MLGLCSNTIMISYFFALLTPICNLIFSFPPCSLLFHLLIPPPNSFSPSLWTPLIWLPLSFPAACCSFLNLWISEHHFLDFSTPRGDILIPALLFFHLISSLLSESPRQDVRWQCGPWRLGWVTWGCGGLLGVLRKVGIIVQPPLFPKKQWWRVIAIPNSFLHMTRGDVL